MAKLPKTAGNGDSKNKAAKSSSRKKTTAAAALSPVGPDNAAKDNAGKDNAGGRKAARREGDSDTDLLTPRMRGEQGTEGAEGVEGSEEAEDDFESLDPESLSGDLALDGIEEDGVPAGNLPLVPDAPGTLAVFARHPPERARDSLQTYLREINRFPLLEPEEELELARRVRDTGDADAAFRLISSHLRLVVRVAMDFQRRWMQNVLDLVQEGNVGLVRAVSKFDPEKGIKFSYYATFWIKAYILKFIMDNWRLVKIGTTQTQRKLFYNLNKERQLLVAQGFDPDSRMLAERLNVPVDQIVEMEQRLDASDMSLDAPISEEDAGSASRMDYLPALGPGIEETLGNNEISHIVRERLESLIPSLNDKEQYILEHRLLSDDPVTLREIGDLFTITRERVRQIEARLLQKVRDHLFKNIKDFSRDWIEH